MNRIYYLQGSETVEKAAGTMRHSAEMIRDSVGQLEEILRFHRGKMAELVFRLEQVLDQRANGR